MTDPLDVLGALLDLVGPFLFPVVLFVAGLIGYGVLVALGRIGVFDGEERPSDDRPREGSADGERGGGSRRDGSRRE